AIYRVGTSPTLCIASISSPVRLLLPGAFPPSSMFFHASRPHSSHPYTHRFHSALALAAFVVDIVITSCTVRYTQ
ncbi:hypothetical protein F4604DRAFT_1813719, partial [Suillus subluteus]